MRRVSHAQVAKMVQLGTCVSFCTHRGDQVGFWYEAKNEPFGADAPDPDLRTRAILGVEDEVELEPITQDGQAAMDLVLEARA